MTDQEKKDHHFDVPPVASASDAAEEQHHHFEADIPKAPQNARRTSKRGGFGSDFTPKRDFSGPRTPSQTDSSTDSGETKPMTTFKTKPTIPVKSEWAQKLPFDASFETVRLGLIFLLLFPLTLFAYWPAVKAIVHTWWTQVDYGHGFFIIPLVALFLYLRADTYPGSRVKLTWFGLLPIVVCFAMRYVAAGLYMDALEQWSILFWVFGIVWFFYGSRVFLWALPSLAYLTFMFPLPYRYEVLLRGRLQEIAAQLGAALLQLMGEPAIAIKNTIRLSTQELAVETACSGIRFLISILAIAFGAILLMRRPWWQNILVILIAVPLAIFVNGLRIALTGILLLHFPGFLDSITPIGQRPGVVADEIAGLTMIVVAIVIFFTFLWYLGKVFRRIEI